jgi:hypothetical protein
MTGLRVVVMFFICFLFSNSAFGGGAKTVWVNSYTRSNGTYVSGHWRSPPDGGGTAVYVPSSYPDYSAHSSSGVSGNTEAIRNSFNYEVNIYYKRSSSGSTLRIRSSSSYQDSAIIAEEEAVYEAQEKLRNLLYESYSLDHVLVAKEIERIFSQENCASIVRDPFILKWYIIDSYMYTTIRETVMTCTGIISTIGR